MYSLYLTSMSLKKVTLEIESCLVFLDDRKIIDIISLSVDIFGLVCAIHSQGLWKVFVFFFRLFRRSLRSTPHVEIILMFGTY